MPKPSQLAEQSPATIAAFKSALSLPASVYKPESLQRWFAALGDARYSSASISAVGDSITVGAYANNNAGVYTAADEPIFAERGWAGQLRSLFATQYGDPGEGIILPSDKRVTFSGGATNADTALTFHSGGTQLGAASGRTITVSLPVCTEFDILLWTPYGASGAFTYTIDGGSAQVGAASPATQNTAYKVSVTGLASTTHTLVINAPASGGALFWYGVNVRRQATGVRVHRLGKSGATTTTGLNIGLTDSFSGTGSVQERSWRNGIGPNAASSRLVIVALGSNDAAAPQVSPSTYKANLQSFITYVTGTLGACVLLCSDPRRAIPNGLTYPESDYYTAMRQLADENSHVAYLDIAQSFGTYAQATDANIGLYADTIHPARNGHGVIAQTMFSVLSTPARYPGT